MLILIVGISMPSFICAMGVLEKSRTQGGMPLDNFQLQVAGLISVATTNIENFASTVKTYKSYYKDSDDTMYQILSEVLTKVQLTSDLVIKFNKPMAIALIQQEMKKLLKGGYSLDKFQQQVADLVSVATTNIENFASSVQNYKTLYKDSDDIMLKVLSQVLDQVVSTTDSGVKFNKLNAIAAIKEEMNKLSIKK